MPEDLSKLSGLGSKAFSAVPRAFYLLRLDPSEAGGGDEPCYHIKKEPLASLALEPSFYSFSVVYTTPSGKIWVRVRIRYAENKRGSVYR